MLNSGQIFILTLVLSENKFLNKKKTIPPPCKLNRQSLNNNHSNKNKRNFGILSWKTLRRIMFWKVYNNDNNSCDMKQLDLKIFHFLY